MRWDMYKVIVERPRVGGKYEKKVGRQRMRDLLDPESAPLHQPNGRGRGNKFLNENLAPLRRFLLSRAGRPWAEVHAEISANLRLDSAVQKHVLDHLKDMVYTHVVRVGDQLLDYGENGVTELRRCRWTAFYVCPDTGVLRRIARVPRFEPPPPPDVVPIDSKGQYRRIDGHWFHITLAPVPSGEAWLEARDVVLGKRLAELGSSWQCGELLREHYGRSDRYAVAKRQLGKKELRRLPQEVRP